MKDCRDERKFLAPFQGFFISDTLQGFEAASGSLSPLANLTPPLRGLT